MPEKLHPQQVNAAGVLDPYRKMHYRFHQKIDPSLFPQVHDFYELTLVTSGTMYLEANGEEHCLCAGALALLRPGDVHTRKSSGECTYINLAFPAQIMEDMARYLNDVETFSWIREMPQPCMAVLPGEELSLWKDRLEKLNLLPVDRPELTCTQLRWLMLDLVLEYIVPSVLPQTELHCPPWLKKILRHMEDPEHFSDTLQDLEQLTGRSKEHICRGFQKHLGLSPTQYINQKRLNYAANLLLFSDRQVIEVAYASGFQSLSRFYHLFKQTFRCSPLAYRQAAQREKGENPQSEPEKSCAAKTNMLECQ